jgi:hypothetical protein
MRGLNAALIVQAETDVDQAIRSLQAAYNKMLELNRRLGPNAAFEPVFSYLGEGLDSLRVNYSSLFRACWSL